MGGTERTVEADAELVKVLGIRRVNGRNEVLQGALETRQLFEWVLEHSASPSRLFPAQVIYVDDKSVPVFTDHVLYFATVEALVLLYIYIATFIFVFVLIFDGYNPTYIIV